MEPRERSGATVVAAPLPRVFKLAAVKERMLVFDDVRWWRCEGTGCVGPERRWFEEWSNPSLRPLDVEDALETTEALCAARSMESSRVRRLTCYMLHKDHLGIGRNYLRLLLVPSQAADVGRLQ